MCGGILLIEFEFDERELEQLEKELTAAIKKCPVYAGETLKELAKDFKNSAKKRANSELKHTKREGDDKKFAINKKWGHELIDENLGMTALIWNNAPHFHLVENGHNLVKGGKLGKGGRIIGFVPGKHIMERTRNEYKDIVYERFEKMVDDILKESGFN